MNFDIAMSLADILHKGQTRKGMPFPFIIHPVDVVRRLMLWGVEDDVTLSAAILHDVREDSDITHEHLADIVGEKVAGIVEELTFTGNIPKSHYLRSFGYKSTQALTIKLADRFSNVADYQLDNPQYALRYLNKAEALVADGLMRIDDLNVLYGNNVGTRAFADLKNLRKQLHLALDTSAY